MESRFAHLRQRDASVSMLRVKMSRRRSQSQKENRERAVNTRRQLDKLPELEISQEASSIAMADVPTTHKKNCPGVAKKEAAEERIKQLERWRERKALEKEKEKREKERKGVFKTGWYHPKDTFALVPLPVVSASSTRAKEAKGNTVQSQSSRVTRSMKQQRAQEPLKTQDPNAMATKAQAAVDRSTRSRVDPLKPAPGPTKTRTQVCKVEPVVRALSTRSSNRPPGTAAPALRGKPRDRSADIRTTRSRAGASAVAPPSERERKLKDTVSRTVQPKAPKEPEQKAETRGPEETPCPPGPTPSSEEEDMVMDAAQPESIPAVDPVEAPSFAPEGFVFQAPTGLSFRFEPLTPRSADAFLTPSLSFSLPPAPVFDVDLHAEPREPSPPESICHSLHTSPAVDPPTSDSPLESKYDVPYFRSEIANETDGLTNLCVHWEAKVEDESIPEEMRDRMRTAVGQARLLMKERFKQFSGLVDDCELGRGEKVTTCTDLQGFWDMVFYQVEDVRKKFDALEEAERRDWVEEHKPLPPPQRKVVKKQSAAPAKPTGKKTVAKSRLAAVKAAMKAKQQAAEEAAKDAGDDGAAADTLDPQPKAEPQPFESPAKPTGLRRSRRLSVKVLHQASPCSNTPPRRVTLRSVEPAQTPVHTAASPAPGTRTPPHSCLNLTRTPARAPTSRRATPQSSHHRRDAADVSLCFSPVTEVPADNGLPEGSPERQSERAAELSVPTPCVRSPPSSSVVEEQGEPAEDVDTARPVTPCKTLPVSRFPEISPCQSVASPMLVSPKQPPMASSTVEVQESVCHTPDSSLVEDTPGFDIERYLRPSQRLSLSPGETVAVETLSPMALDIEMESPSGETKDLLTQQEAALPTVSSALTPQSPQKAEGALLLYTPDLKDRIRQSVCPSDLMVFTPPF